VLRHANAAGIPDWTYPTVNSVSVAGALDPVLSEDEAMVQQFLHYGLPAAQTPASNAPATTSSNSAAAGSSPTSPSITSSPSRVSGGTASAVSLALKLISASSGAGLEASGASPLTTTPADQVQVDSSSYYDGAYVPPGLQPGQVPQRCPA
jgi:hypothetical protein